MAENQNIGREYIIPLRKAWLRVPEYERTGKAVKAIKLFIAKHMKVLDRDLDRVKLDVYFNNEVWFRGRASPPAKVKVKAIKEGDIVKVTFADTPKHVDFLKKKHDKFRQKEVKKEAPKVAEKKEEVKTEEQKKDETEKEKSVEQQNIKQAEQQAKAEKHLTKVKEPEIQRMAMKR